jgi:S-methylmethionine-dependent homocysteine/selenocysteine methylase
MNSTLRKQWIKIASRAIGECCSVKPEKQAEAVVDALFAAFKIVETDEIRQGDKT